MGEVAAVGDEVKNLRTGQRVIPPDNNFSGYDFWLAKMNFFTQPGEDARNDQVATARVQRAEMVRAFIVSSEYRQRFPWRAGRQPTSDS